MPCRSWCFLVALALFLSPLAPRAEAADLSLAASNWTAFTGSGTLANAADTVPGVGGTTVLSAQSTGGTSFGFIQANYEALNQPGRFVRAQVKSTGKFILYVRARGSDGKDYYLVYNSFTQVASAAANGYLNLTLSAEYPARYNQYQTYTLDVQRDLERLVPGVTLAYIRWIAARGPMAIGSLAILTTVDYLAADDDGDLLTGAEEDALGTSPFLFDTDGDGVADGLEAANPCGSPLDAAVPANLDADPDGDGLATRTELFLGSDCGVPTPGALPTAYGWEAYFPSAAFPAGASLATGADGALVITHSSVNPLGLGVLSPPQQGPLRLPAYLNAPRDVVVFDVKSSEPFYLYVRVKGTNGQQYYLAYPSGSGAPSYGSGYATLPLRTLGYTINGAAYTTVSRNLSTDLSSLVPGVTVSRILWLAVRGRLSLKDIAFDAAAPVVSGLAVSPAPLGLNQTATLTFDVNKPVPELPSVTVGGRPAMYVTNTGSHYTYAYTSGGADVSGPAAVSVEVIDARGLSGSAASWVEIDVDPPYLLAAGAQPAPAWEGEELAVALEASEPLRVTPSLTLAGRPAAYTGMLGAAYTYAFTVGADAVWGDCVLVDLAGNEATVPLSFWTVPRPTVTGVDPDPAHGNLPLTLRGSGFGDAGRAFVGGAEATVGAWSDTEITLWLPALDGGRAPLALEMSAGPRTVAAGSVQLSPDVVWADPSSVRGGGTLTVWGYYLTATAGTATLGGVPLVTTGWAPYGFSATVPADVPPGVQALQAEAGGVTGDAYALTVVPTLEYGYAVYRVGDTVKLSGANLGHAPGTGDGLFDYAEHPVAVASWSMGSVSFVVPEDAASFWRPVHVVAGGQRSDDAYLMVAPYLKTVAPAVAASRETVTLTGSYFPSVFEPDFGMAVLFDGNPIDAFDVLAWDGVTITVRLPWAGGGAHSLAIRAYGEESNAQTVYYRPTIFGPTLLVGEPGEELEVNGNGFGFTADRLLVGGVEATVLDWQDYRIRFTVPAAAPATYAVEVAVGSYYSAPVSLEVLAPRPEIDFAEPAQPAIGEVVTFHGHNFGAARGTGTVWIGSVAADVVSWSDTAIEAVVPLIGGGMNWAGVVAGERPDLEVGLVYPLFDWGSYVAASLRVLPPLTVTDVKVALSFNRYIGNRIVFSSPGGQSAALTEAGGWVAPSSLFDVPTPVAAGSSLDVFDGSSATGWWNIDMADAEGYALRAWHMFFRGGVTGYQAVAGQLQVRPRITAARVVVDGTLIEFEGGGFVSPWDRVQEARVDGVLYTNASAENNLRGWVTAAAPLPDGSHTLEVSIGGLWSDAFTFVVATGPYLFYVSPSPVTAGDTFVVAGQDLGETAGLLTVGGASVASTAWMPLWVAGVMPASITAGTRLVRIGIPGAGAGGGGPVGSGTFTTYTAADTPVAIPDAGSGVSQIDVADTGTVASLRVSIDVTQTGGWFGDLTLLLRAPDGTAIVLEQGAYDVTSNLTTTYDTLRAPRDPMSGMAGVSMAGAWRLEVSDGWSGYGVGNVNAWSLEIEPVSAAVTSGTFAATGLPLGIYDYALTSAPIEVTGLGGTVTGADVSLALTHTYYADLVLRLRHPDGTTVILQQNVWQDPNTTFDTYTAPAESLTAFDGKPANGTWTLEVEDTAGGDTGSLTDVALMLTTTSSGVGSGGAYTYTNEVPIRIRPNVTAVAPATVGLGTLVTLSGTNFGDAADAGAVVIGGASAVVNSWSMDTIEAYVPTSLSAGSVTAVVLQGGEASAPVALFATPQLISVSTYWAYGGDIVTLTGGGFGAVQGAGGVYLGGMPLPVVSWSATSIQVQIPNDFPVGGRTLGVTTNEGLQTNESGMGVTPHIVSVSPLSATGGDTIVISGTNFGAVQGASTVAFSYVSASVVSWSQTAITVIVPNGAQAGTSRPVQATIAGNSSNYLWMTITPAILAVSPAVAAAGASVTVTGKNFGNIKSTSTLSIGGTVATTTSWTATQIVAAVPAGAVPGTQSVAVSVGGQGASSSLAVAPKILSLAPASGAVGSAFVITGQSFGATPGGISVGGVAATVDTWSNTSIAARVPALPMGGQDVVVTAAGYASNAVTFTVRPNIAALSVTTGTGSTPVVISGTGFGASQGVATVTFGGVVAAVTGWSDTSITATVPEAVTAGTRPVSVNTAVGASNSFGFVVTPFVAGVSPASGGLGATLTITGTNFGSTSAGNAVRVDGVSLGVTSWSPLEIRATIGSSVAGGVRPLQVAVGAAYSNTTEVEILPTLSGAVPLTGGVGDGVTLTGANLGAGGTVYFGAQATTASSWTNGSVAVAVPDGLPNGALSITVVPAGGSASNAVAFTVDNTPALTAVSPAAVTAGTLVTASGARFGPSQGAGTLTVGGQAATIVAWANQQIVFRVPRAATPGAAAVVVTAAGVPTAPKTLTVSPSIWSSTQPAYQTTQATLTGANFGASQGTSAVSLDGVTAPVAAWYATAITLVVPRVRGAVPAVVWANGTYSNSFTVTVNSPYITSRYPAQGTTGTTLTIRGYNLGPPSGTVTIGGVAAAVVSWYPGLVTVTVAAGTPKGTSDIVLSDTLGGLSNPVPYRQRGADVWLLAQEVPVTRRSPAVWTGQEMIVWGGAAAENLGTGARYNPTTDSWLPTSMTGAPSKRSGHTLVWTGRRMLVFGGTSAAEGGYAYDPYGDSWSPLPAAGAPAARHSHAAVWTGTEMIVWGGRDEAGTFLYSGGRYDPKTNRWSATSLAGAPEGRVGMVAVWTGQQMIIWGGSGAATYYSGSRYSPATNSWAATANPPVSLDLSTGVWTGSRMLVFGCDAGGCTSSYTLVYNPAANTWSLGAGTGAPSARYHHAAVWTGSRMLVWGGERASQLLGDGASYDPVGNSWSALSAANAPSARSYHSAVWTGAVMLVWGGDSNTGAKYMPVSNTWAQISPVAGPGVRVGRTHVWTGSEMVVWGGYRYGKPLQGGAKYNPATDTWTAVSSSGAPTSRGAFNPVWTGSAMIVWGGFGDTGAGGLDYLATGASYDPASNAWSPLAGTPPAARQQYSAVWTGSRMIVWGGLQSGAVPGRDGASYEPGIGWSPVNLTGAPSVRFAHTAVWTGARMIVWGGYGSDALNDGAQYDPAGNTWTAVQASGAPAARYDHAAAWTGTYMVVWGGGTASGGRYDPLSNTWSSIAAAGAPAVTGGNAVWSGSELFVWGGPGETSGRYDPAANTWAPMANAPEAEQRAPAVFTGAELLVYNHGLIMRYLP